MRRSPGAAHPAAGPGGGRGWPEAEGPRPGQVGGASPSPSLARWGIGAGAGTRGPGTPREPPSGPFIPPFAPQVLMGPLGTSGRGGTEMWGPSSHRVCGHSCRRGSQQTGKLRHARPEVVCLLGMSENELCFCVFLFPVDR